MRPSKLLPAAVLAAALLTLPSTASAETLVGVDSSNRLASFNSVTPSRVTTKAITGLPAGEKVVGLDRRPANATVVALTSASRIYTLDVATGAATPIGMAPFTPVLEGTSFGFDFNPVVDRIRLTTNFGQNLRLVPDTGAVAFTDGRLQYGMGDPSAGKPVAVAASAYTNNVAGAMATQLFNIDTANDVLALQDPPNNGILKTIGSLQSGDVLNPVAFDIGFKNGTSFAVMRQKNRRGSRLFTINLTTGRAQPLGQLGTSKKPVTLGSLTIVG